MRRNARRAIAIAVLFTAVTGVGLLVVVRLPDMHVASVNTERIVLETGGKCDYFVWLNHAPDCADCRYYDGVRVISATDFSRLTVYWDAIDLDQPAGGDCFCGSWHCYNDVGWHGGELWDVVVWRLWLPMVMSNAR